MFPFRIESMFLGRINAPDQIDIGPTSDHEAIAESIGTESIGIESIDKESISTGPTSAESTGITVTLAPDASW